MLSNIRQPCDEAVVRSQPEVTDCGPETGRWVLAAAILGSGITFIDGTVVNVALPVLQRELGATVAEAQWIVESLRTDAGRADPSRRLTGRPPEA